MTTERIPQSAIDEIRRRVDIVEVIGEVLPLQRAGRSFKGLCPFHQEKTASFTVSPDRQAYHCFGCGAGGNVISFVMEFDKVGFVEAVRSLARRAGVAVPEPRRADPAEQREHDAIFHALRLAQTLYRSNLEDERAGKAARRYLAERGITAETSLAFGLGYAPAGWEELAQRATREGIPAEILVKSGLAKSREESGGHYDVFRNRIIFPIVGTSDRVLGFGGRSLGDEEPKYMNSSETPVFRKGQNLYGLPQARDAIRSKGSAVVVEGYMDLIALHQAGARHVVAPLGTAFGPEQGRLLARYAPAATIAFDGDAAGRRAVWLAAPWLWESGLRVRVATLPEGEDPDSLVRRAGLAGWEAIESGARDFVEFGFEEAADAAALDDVLRRMVAALAGVRDDLRRAMYARAVAERAGIPEETLLRSVKREIERRRGGAGAAERAAGATSAATEQTPEERADLQAERDLLHLLLECPHLQPEVAPRFSPDLFADESLRAIAEAMRRAWDAESTLTAEDLMRLDGEAALTAGAAAVLVAREDETWIRAEGRDGEWQRRRAVNGFLGRLHARADRRRRMVIEEQTRIAQAKGELSRAFDLLRSTDEVRRREVGIGDKEQ